MLKVKQFFDSYITFVNQFCMEYIPTQGSKYDVGFHEVPLITSWLVLANLTIIVGAFKWHKYSYYIHAIIGLVIVGLTLAGTLHVLFDVGIGYNPTKRFQILHNTVGLIVVIWLSFQFITGVFSRILFYSDKVHASLLIWTKRSHYISGFLIMALAKFEYSIIFYRRKKYGDILGFLFFDCICLAIYCWVKFKYPTLSEKIIQSQLRESKDVSEQEISNQGVYGKMRKCWQWLKQKIVRNQLKLPKIKYLPAIYQSERQILISNYFIFNDYVYELDPIEQIHPGGQKIISLIRQRQVDRFLYGFYPIEIPSGFITHRHSEDSLKICGEPIAKIERNTPIKNLPDYALVKMTHCKKIHSKSPLHLIHFEPVISQSQNWIQFKYEGFTHQQQFGQYFSLNLSNISNQDVTRLYTAIWCLRPQNIEFMEKYFPGSTTNQSHQFNQSAIQIDSEIIFEKQEVIPLMIKRYDEGEMTQKLMDLNFQPQLILSRPMGAGLRYDTLQNQGKLIIVAGGTGLLPFLDLIDVLYKRTKILQKSKLSTILLKNDPVIQEDLIQNRQFMLYFACQRIQDTHPLALYQINMLSNSKLINFKAFFRVRNQETNHQRKQYQNIIFQKNKFNEQLIKILQNQYGICKLYICGPSSMTADFSQILQTYQLPPDIYHFV